MVANFIASADGRATFQGRSGRARRSTADRCLFHGLREQADAVFAGTRTLKIERYGRILRDAERRAAGASRRASAPSRSRAS